MELFVGDLEPTLEVTFTRENVAVDLSAATSVTLTATIDGATLFADEAATITDAVNGVVQYAWQVEDTDTAGLLSVRASITWPGGRKETVRVVESIRILS